MARIFCVEDCVDTKRILQVILGREHELHFFDGLSALEQWLVTNDNMQDGSSPQLLLLDISLPDGSGMEFMAKAGERLEARGIDVIFLTGTNTAVSRIRGFSLGAVDYIAKPFDPMEVMVRVNSKLRGRRLGRANATSNQASELAPLLQTSRLDIDLNRQMVVDRTCSKDSQNSDIRLTPVEFRLLVLLVRQHQLRPQLPVSRETIADTVFGKNHTEEANLQKRIGSRSIDHHVSALRKKLTPLDHKIDSIYGVGYRITWT
jgi:DNA-binding response OmpR family regulator